MVSREELADALRNQIIDIHGVAHLLGMSRSSVNTLLVRPSSNFPPPVYETRGEGRHPVRLWLRSDVMEWHASRRQRS